LKIAITKESIIDQTCLPQIFPNPSFSKRGIPPFVKGGRDFVLDVMD
jgi:hypothetical protein